MGKILNVKENGKLIYDIRIESDYKALKDVFRELKTEGHRICIVSDTTISNFYMEEVVDIAKDYASVVETFTLTPGEEHKNLESVYQLYEYLIESKFDRKDFLVALGGGVVGDLTGYVAATYLRGISFIQMPTTLLSMVDSSIGGKTGVDFHAYKNMIGAFKQPKAVYINTSTLNTLNDRLYFSGYGEVTKYGYIQYCPYGSLHSTGMIECEAPVFSKKNGRIIEENMAICIDAYFKGMEWGSFRVEDCYLIEKDGAKRMTTYNDTALPKIFK